MIGIYHNRDLDGFASGAIIKHVYPDAEMIGYDYSEPTSKIFEVLNRRALSGEVGPVIMADVSLPMNLMLRIAQASKFNFTWIDHHISAINEYKSFTDGGEAFCNAVLENGISACEGVWKHLMGSSIPTAIVMLGEYDTWRNEDKYRWENQILPFQYGMRQLCNSLESFPKKYLTNGPHVHKTVENGKLIMSYQNSINEKQCKTASFEHDFDGLRAICLNGGGFNSNVFNSVYDESKHDIMMPFQFNGKNWTVSLYTTKENVDCSVLAKKQGGGGHKKAAGFQVDDIRKIFNKMS